MSTEHLILHLAFEQVRTQIIIFYTEEIHILNFAGLVSVNGSTFHEEMGIGLAGLGYV